MDMLKVVILSANLALLGGCASITAGTTQDVAVETPPKTGAECKLSNEKGSWNIPSTPGSTTVTKAYSAMNVTCKHPDGSSGVAVLQSTTAGATFGNIIAGGLVGAAVDMGTGAAYAYPAKATVTLVAP